MLVLLAMWALLYGTYASADGTPIPITFYTNFGLSSGCTTPSTVATNISLEIGVCVVTPGLGSFHLDPFPCASGSVQNYVFTDTACGQVGGSLTYYRTGADSHCYTAFDGPFAAIMLSCNQETPEQPSATTTITVGAVATGASSSSSTSSTRPTSSNGGGDNSSSSGTSNSSPASGWNSLDLGTRIGIIVSLAVGIPPIILSIYMILQRKRRKAEEQQAQSHGTPMQMYPPYPHMHGGGGGVDGYFPLAHNGREPPPSRPTPQVSRAQMDTA